MAVTNREIMFVIKMRNEANRVLREFVQQQQAGGKSTKDVSNSLKEAQKQAKDFATSAKSASDSVNTAGRSAKTAGNSFRDAGRDGKKGFDEVGDAADRAKRDVEDLADGAELVKRGFSGLAGLFTGLFTLDKVRDAVVFMRDYGDRVGELRAVMGGATPEFQSLLADVEQLGAVSVQGADGVAQMGIILGKAGLTAKQAGENLKVASEFAVAAGEDNEAAAEFLVNTANAFKRSYDDLAAIADISQTIVNETTADMTQFRFAMQYTAQGAATLGISINDASAAIGTLLQNGARGETAGTGIRVLFGALAADSKKTTEALGRMGLKFADVDLKTVGLRGALQKLKDANIDYGSAAALVGQEGANQLLTLTQNIEMYDKLADATRNAAGSTSEFSKELTDTLGGDWLRFIAIVKQAVINVGNSGIGDALRSALQTVTGVIGAFTGDLENMSQFTEEQKARFEALASVIKIIAPLLLAVVATNFFTWLASGAGILGTVFRGMTSFGTSLLSVRAAASTLGGVLSTLWGGVTRGVAALAGVAVQVRAMIGTFGVWKTAIFGVTGGLRALGAALLANPLGIALAAIAGLIAAYIAWKDEMIVVGGRLTTLGDIVAVVFDRIREAASAVVTFLVEMWNDVTSAISTFASGAGSTLLNLAKTIISYFKAVGNFFINLWVGNIKVAVGFAKSLVNTMSSAVKAVINSFNALGRTISAVLRGDFASAAKEASGIFKNGFEIDTASLTSSLKGAMASMSNDTIGDAVNAGKKIGTALFGGILDDAQKRTLNRGVNKAVKDAYSTDLAAAPALPGNGEGTGTEKDKSDRARSDRSAERAARELASAIDNLVSKYAPLIQTQRKYAEEQELIAKLSKLSTQELEKHGLTHKQLAGISEIAARKFKEETDATFKFTQQLEDTRRSIGQTNNEREITNQLLPVERELRDQVTLGLLTEQQAAEKLTKARRDLAEVQAINSANSFNENFTERLQGMRDELYLSGLLTERERERGRAFLEVAREAQKANVDIRSALEQYADLYEQVEQRKKDAMEDWKNAALNWFDEYRREAENTAQNVTDIFSTAVQGIEDALVDFTKNGKFDVGKLYDQISEEITRKGFKLIISEIGGLAGLGEQENAPDPVQTAIQNALTQVQTNTQPLTAIQTTMQQLLTASDPLSQPGSAANPAQVVVQNISELSTFLNSQGNSLPGLAQQAQQGQQVLGQVANDNGLKGAVKQAGDVISTEAAKTGETIADGTRRLSPELNGLINVISSAAGMIGGAIGGKTGSVIGSLIGMGLQIWAASSGAPTGGSFHSGGRVGSGGTPVRIAASLVRQAKRYHDGGTAVVATAPVKTAQNLKPGEVPAILQTGEYVLSRADVATLRAALSAENDNAVRRVLANVYHSGGRVTGGGVGRLVSPAVLANARRYHTGGAVEESRALVGRASGGYNSRQQERMSLSSPTGGPGSYGGRTTNVTVHQYITTPDANSFRQSQGQQATQVAGAMRRAASRNS